MFTDQWQCFAEQIRLDHAQIERLVRTVRRACQQEATQFRSIGLEARLVHLQRALEHQLDQHKCGYIEDAVSTAPRFGRQAEHLRRQRAAQIRRIGRIVTELQHMQGDPENRRLLAVEITDVLNEIQANEKAETKLVEAALNVDLDLYCGNGGG